MTTTFAATWLGEVEGIARRLNAPSIEKLVEAIHYSKRKAGRVFVLGVGGSAANASHCVNDLRMRVGVEAYAPTDGIAELLARVNDYADGWSRMFSAWLNESRVMRYDLVLILSVSGATPPLVEAAKYAKHIGARVAGILGTPGSDVEKLCDVAIVVPCPMEAHRAGHAEAFQSVVWHAVVAHPRFA